MKVLSIQEERITEVFEKINLAFGGDLKTNPLENLMTIENIFGNGYINGMTLQNGISYIEFNLSPNEDMKISINSPKKSILNFVYCSKGEIGHSFGSYNEINTVETFQTGITSNITDTKNIIFLSKGIEINAIIILVDTSCNGEGSNKVNQHLRQLFIDGGTDNCLHLGSYNLRISKTVRQLKTITQTGLTKTILTQGLINVILGLEIEQYINDLNKLNLCTLTKKELKSIRATSDLINNHPEHNYCLDELAQSTGLSKAKLQEGFKFMHNSTVNHYIRSVRIDKSEHLIKTTDLNISEIVYSVGITNRSYFSKIFKERFECTPYDYRSKISLATTA